MSDPVLVARANIGNAVKAGDAEAERAARQQLAEARLERAVNEAIAAAPPLTDAARERIANLLTAGAAS